MDGHLGEVRRLVLGKLVLLDRCWRTTRSRTTRSMLALGRGCHGDLRSITSVTVSASGRVGRGRSFPGSHATVDGQATAGYEIASGRLVWDASVLFGGQSVMVLWCYGVIDSGRQIWARPGRPLRTRRRSNKIGGLSREEEMKCNEREV